MFSILLTVVSLIFNFTPGCENKNDEFTCNYFVPCSWNKEKQKCTFGRRGLRYDEDAYAVDEKGMPKLRKWFNFGR